MRALLLLDIDGVLNPWAARTCPPGYVAHHFRRGWWGQRRQAWLRPEHGPALRGLAERTGAELVWASSWAHDANITVGAVLGLPPLPVIEFAGPHADTGPAWKYRAVARFAYGRPLAWLDDDFDLRAGAKEEFLARRDVPTLLVPIDPAVGVTDADLASVERWLPR
ncbi:HAD domain-containing protein [Actinophytocola sp.]|uniref:HAD domain-containing protein n=1 Tax=Actinophytocola sp. TaxID=1872138 RepID=UPI002ED3A5EF